MVRELKIIIDKRVFWVFLAIITASGIFAIAEGVRNTNLNAMGYRVYNATTDWTDINDTSYPVACPADSAITLLGDSVTCTAYNTGLTWLNSTNVNATKVYADWYCLTPSCNHNITFNGTDSIIQ